MYFLQYFWLFVKKIRTAISNRFSRLSLICYSWQLKQKKKSQVLLQDSAMSDVLSQNVKIVYTNQHVHSINKVMRLSTHLIVYSRVPLSTSRRSLLGVVMLWATDFFPLWKKVSGVQILLARRLLSGRTCMGPSNFSLSSLQLWRKNTSIVYSWKREK